MRIVVTGREGQVARSLFERGTAAGHEIVLLGRPELDLAGDPERIRTTVEKSLPELIVSAAAYTAVDKAEAEPELAFAVNARAAGAVARAARSLSVPLIHLSTDYVFSGTKDRPYHEEDETAPGGVYGASKLAGEEAVLGAHDDAAVLRTAWVYSPFGTNFVKTMLSLAATREEVTVVADQIGNPTSALDIALGVVAVATNLASSGARDLRGIFHMTGEGDANWADFAEEIFRISGSAGGPSAVVRRVPTADYPTAARRPANSRLDSSKLGRVHAVRLPQWQMSLNQVVRRLTRQTTEQDKVR